MDNTVVVTVTTRSWTFRYDMELPTGQMVVALKRDIIEATLDIAEVWNGDYIAIEPAY